MDKGEDTAGATYASVADLWKELGTSAGREGWYAKGTSYWENQEATINGVLGGYPETHGPDLRESRRFLDLLLRRAPAAPGNKTVLDCGAGIGRVSEGLLQHLFDKVDLAEPNERLLETAEKAVDRSKAGRFFAASLQDLEPDHGYYDVIWAQWVLLYLPDDDLVAFLRRCAAGLRSGGAICIKENVVLEGNWVVDRDDNSIARTDAQYKAIFRRAGLSLTAELKQTCWPKDLIPVKMYALQPRSAQRSGTSGGVRKRPAASR